jgi:hypothetical protein
MAEKEGKTPKDLSSDGPKAERAAARDAAHAAHDAEVAERHDAVVAERNAAAAEDGQATAIDSGVAAEPAELPEEIEAGLPTEPAPEEGTLGQAPVLTPSTFAPISSQPLPNAQRDATKIATSGPSVTLRSPVAPVSPSTPSVRPQPVVSVPPWVAMPKRPTDSPSLLRHTPSGSTNSTSSMPSSGPPVSRIPSRSPATRSISWRRPSASTSTSSAPTATFSQKEPLDANDEPWPRGAKVHVVRV